MASEVDNQVVEQESRQARIILATTILQVIGAMAGLMIQSSGLDPNAEDDAERLVDRADPLPARSSSAPS